MRTPRIFFHGTSPEAAAVILTTGFRDADRGELRGVWISDKPVGEHGGETFLEIALVPGLAIRRLRDYECTLNGSTYREWCVPAEQLNTLCMLSRLLTQNSCSAKK